MCKNFSFGVFYPKKRSPTVGNCFPEQNIFEDKLADGSVKICSKINADVPNQALPDEKKTRVRLLIVSTFHDQRFQFRTKWKTVDVER